VSTWRLSCNYKAINNYLQFKRDFVATQEQCATYIKEEPQKHAAVNVRRHSFAEFFLIRQRTHAMPEAARGTVLGTYVW
jgi:hypothetical protein